jgi:hypothetical protein
MTTVAHASGTVLAQASRHAINGYVAVYRQTAKHFVLGLYATHFRCGY